MTTARPRIRKVAAPPEPEQEYDIVPEHPAVPEGWVVGQLLNVRATGSGYNVTLMPEEYDPRYPERAMVFTNYGQCQDFVSKWYARIWHDPRA